VPTHDPTLRMHRRRATRLAGWASALFFDSWAEAPSRIRASILLALRASKWRGTRLV
jgi:hypothetical protein